MSRRRGRAWLAAVAVLAVCGTPAAAAPPSGGKPALRAVRPNIVFLMTDDQTAASLSAMAATNRLLAAEGTSFSRTFVSFPICCPSRATFFTGQYAHNHGVLHNRPPFGGYVKLDKTNWLPVWLQQAGYRTINVGRTLNGYGLDNPNRAEVAPGWTEWYAPLDPSTFNYYEYTFNENGTLVGYPRPGEGNEHLTDFENRLAAHAIERAAPSAQPFFLSVTWSAPHSGRPATSDDPPDFETTEPAPRYRNAFAGTALPRSPSFDEADVRDKPRAIANLPRLTPERTAAVQESYQQRLESLLSVDEGVKAIHDALARSGELGNTLIVFTSDNGYFQGEHRIPFGKGLPYEPAVRVPLVMRGPGVPRGRRLTQLVGNVDVAPTILEAAGAAPGRVPDGRSLLKLMRDPGLEWGRDLLFENGRGANGVTRFAAIRTYRYLYARHYRTGESELYDLKRDPDEMQSLDHDKRHAKVRSELAHRLRRLRRCGGAGCRARPRLKLVVRARRNRARRCLNTDLRTRVGGRDRRWLGRVDFFFGRRRVARDGRSPFRRTLPLRRLRRGRKARLRVRTVLRDGRVRTLDRRVRRCR